MEKRLEIVIKNEEDVFDKYSNDKLNEELVNYIAQNAPKLRKNETIFLTIKNETKKKYKEAIEKGLKLEQLKYHKWQYLKDIAQLIFIVIGVVLLYLATVFDREVISELFSIGGWVFIWFVCESEIVEETRRRKKYNLIDKILVGTIEETFKE